MPVWGLIWLAALAITMRALNDRREFGAGDTVALFASIAIPIYVSMLLRRWWAGRRQDTSQPSRRGVYR